MNNSTVQRFTPTNWSAAKIFWAGAGVAVVCILVSLVNIGRFTMDEKIFHYPNVLNTLDNGIGAIFNSRYSAANTPLPYFIVAGFAKIFSPSLGLARIVTFAISLASFGIGLRLLTLAGGKAFCGLVLLFFPYFFLNSFIYYVINYGLFFCLLAFLFYYLSIGKTSLLYDLAIGSALSMAILCQQFYLMVACAIILFRLNDVRTQTPGKINWPHLLGSAILLGLPLLLPAWIFFKWKGLVHPNFKVHSLMLNPSNATGILLVIGFYFTPFIWAGIRKTNRLILAASIALALLLVYFFTPAYADINAPGVFNGIVYHILVIIRSRSSVLFFILMVTLVALGCLAFYRIITEPQSHFNKALLAAALLLTLAYLFNSIMGERHMLGLVFILFIMLLPKLSARGAMFYVPPMMVLGAFYFVYWLFFKFGA